jgi:prevent-host-death family protein
VTAKANGAKTMGRARERPLRFVTVTQFRRRLGWVIRMTKRADVFVTKRGVPILVVLSIRRYQALVRAYQAKHVDHVKP